MKFLCDQMLGSLATWLRLLGYDTAFANNTVSDEEIVQQAQKERRILITRDKQLINWAKTLDLETIPIQTSDLEEQIRLVIGNKKIDEFKILTRCSVCNVELRVAGKSQVEDKVPERIFNEYTFFWSCPSCDRVYWKGSHYDMIKEKINELRKSK